MLVNARFNHVHVAALLAVLSVVLLTATAPDMGLTWDEPTYIVAAERYMAWFGELFTNPAYALSTYLKTHFFRSESRFHLKTRIM